MPIDDKFLDTEERRARRIIFEADCKGLLNCISLCDEKMTDLILKTSVHPFAERIEPLLPKMCEDDRKKIIGTLSSFLTNFQTMARHPGKHPIRIFSLSLLSCFNDLGLMGLDVSGLPKSDLRSFGTIIRWADSFETRMLTSKNAIETWIEPLSKKFKIMQLSKEWEEKAVVFAEKCALAKPLEGDKDKDGLVKRFLNGKIAEPAVYDFYKMNPNEYVDLKIGHSRDFDEPDLKGFPIKGGVKSVEKSDNTFWPSYTPIELLGDTWKKTTYQGSFSKTVQRSPPGSGEWQVLARSFYNDKKKAYDIEIVAVVSPEELGRLCDWTYYLLLKPGFRMTKALQGTKCAYTGWSLFKEMSSTKYREPTGNISIDFS